MSIPFSVKTVFSKKQINEMFKIFSDLKACFEKGVLLILFKWRVLNGMLTIFLDPVKIDFNFFVNFYKKI